MECTEWTPKSLCFMLKNFSFIREFHCGYMQNCSHDLSKISSFSICKSNESTKHYCHQQKRDTQTNLYIKQAKEKKIFHVLITHYHCNYHYIQIYSRSVRCGLSGKTTAKKIN